MHYYTHVHTAQLPETLGDLKKLETLNLERNSLTSLPESLVNIKALKKVILSHNKLAHFPLFLCQLTRLDFADLSSNSINSLPESGIDVFNGVELNLNCNSISVLPAALAKCKRLKVLRVEENTLELGGLPDVILTESNISVLCLDGNLFPSRELQQLPQYDKVRGTLCVLRVYCKARIFWKRNHTCCIHSSVPKL